MAEEKDKKTKAQERMEEKVRQREKKREPEMKISGKSVFELKRLKSKKSDEEE